VEARGMASAGDVEANGRRCPKCGAMIDHLDYWERVINTGEYWRDGLRDVTPSHVDEYYFLCPECGRILFNDIEAAERFLRGQPTTEDDICPRRLLTPHNPIIFYSPQIRGEPKK
jgi:ribosomal protein S27AE